MKIVSVNIGVKRQVEWKNKLVETGIFKFPVEQAIFLGKTDVEGDNVINRVHHGGIDKACYAYSSDCYPFWQKLFPNLIFDYGMLGENLTIEGLDETKILIGDQYQVGEAIVEVSQPRQPCFKLGIRFNDQSVLKHFIKSNFSGVYFRVIQEGLVKKGDELILKHRIESEPSVAEVHEVNYQQVNEETTRKVRKSQFLADAYFK